jgi:CHAD domain-containing protein
MQAILEYERKLDAPGGFELPDLGGDPLEPRVFTSVYYDTAGGSLARSGLTLRRRTERGASVWQLKLPSSGGRLEIEEPGGGARPPSTIADLLVAHVRRAPLTPVAQLRTRRRGALVTRKGTTAEVTLDEVAVMDAQRVVGEFAEIEIELRSGRPKQLRALELELEGAGAKRSDGAPKVFRVLELSRPEVPTSPFEWLRARLRDQLTAILANDPGTRLGRDAESLHDMRVAVRRARALLRAGGALHASDVAALLAELRWLGTVLGTVRDLDVLLERLRAEAEQLDVEDARAARRLLRAIGRERSRARAVLVKTLAGQRYLTVLDRLEETIDGLVPSESDSTLADLAARELRKLSKRARAAGDDPGDEQLHAVRKQAKRARYAYELAGAPQVVKRAKTLQDVLGRHQDAVVAAARLRALSKAAPPAEALAAGRLIERERAARAEARSTWHKAWRRLERSA